MQNLLTLAALGLAAYRATQLVVHDSILSGPRLWLALRGGGTGASAWWRFWWDLASCTYCTGFHLSWITLVTYLTVAGEWGSAPLLVHAVEAWAVAGVQALLNRWDDSRDGGA